MILSGDVEFEYGPIQIHSDTLQIKQGQDNSIELIAEADKEGLTKFELKDEDPAKALTAQARKIIYIHPSGKLVLEGQASVTEGGNKITAHMIRYNTQTGKFSAERAPDGSRVTTEIRLSD